MTHSEKVVDLLHAGQFDEMATELAKAIDTDGLDLLTDLAEYLSMMGFMAESRQVYEKIAAKDANNTDILLNLAEMKFDDGDLDGALDFLGIHRDIHRAAAARCIIIIMKTIGY